MKTYSHDLRQRIMNAMEQGQRTKREIAEMFGVQEPYLYKLARQQPTRGQVEPLPHGGGATAKVTFNALAKAQQRITFDDICGWFLHCGYSYSFI